MQKRCARRDVPASPPESRRWAPDGLAVRPLPGAREARIASADAPSRSHAREPRPARAPRRRPRIHVLRMGHRGAPRGIGIVGDTLHFGLPSGQLGQSTLRGVQTSAAVAGGTTASAFAPAASGTDLWFVDDGVDKVGRITPGAPPVLLTNAIPLRERSRARCQRERVGCERRRRHLLRAHRRDEPDVEHAACSARSGSRRGRNGAVWFTAVGRGRPHRPGARRRAARLPDDSRVVAPGRDHSARHRRRADGQRPLRRRARTGWCG